MKATQEMIQAGAAAARKYMEETGGNSPSAIWDAMWAARPEQPAQQVWVDVARRTEAARAIYEQVRKEFSFQIAPFNRLDADTVQRLVDSISAPLYTSPQPAQKESVTTSMLTDKQKESLTIARNLLADWPNPDRKLLELYSAIEDLLDHKPAQQQSLCDHPCGDIECAVMCKHHEQPAQKEPIGWEYVVQPLIAAGHVSQDINV